MWCRVQWKDSRKLEGERGERWLRGGKGRRLGKVYDVEARPTHLAEPSGKLIIYGDPVKRGNVI